MKRIFGAALSLAMMMGVAVVASVAPEPSPAEANTVIVVTAPPYGFYQDTFDPLCPPALDRKWSPIPSYGTWDSSQNYKNAKMWNDNYFNCRTQKLPSYLSESVGPAVDKSAPYGYYPGTDHKMCPPTSQRKWDSVPSYGTWDNTSSYNNHRGADFGCRTARS
jgi:hypothetical protein